MARPAQAVAGPRGRLAASLIRVTARARDARGDVRLVRERGTAPLGSRRFLWLYRERRERLVAGVAAQAERATGRAEFARVALYARLMIVAAGMRRGARDADAVARRALADLHAERLVRLVPKRRASGRQRGPRRTGGRAMAAAALRAERGECAGAIVTTLACLHGRPRVQLCLVGPGVARRARRPEPTRDRVAAVRDVIKGRGHGVASRRRQRRVVGERHGRPRERRVARVARADRLVRRVAAMTRLALTRRVGEPEPGMTAEARRVAMLAAERPGILRVAERNGLPSGDCVAGVACRGRAGMRLLVTLGASRDVSHEVLAAGMTRRAVEPVRTDEREPVLFYVVADRRPSARVVACGARGAECALVVLAIAVAAVTVERQALPLSSGPGRRVAALACDRGVPSDQRKSRPGVIERRVRPHGWCDEHREHDDSDRVPHL